MRALATLLHAMGDAGADDQVTALARRAVADLAITPGTTGCSATAGGLVCAGRGPVTAATRRVWQ
jgi:hypothetical protein